jgi:hypothetical protein
VSPPVAAPPVVGLEELRVGTLLAEGGEGRVYQLPRQPHLVYKSYARAVAGSHLDDLVAWPTTLGDDRSRACVRQASAWPTSVVTGERGEPIGILMPRAPRRFSVRHRDGHSRLASLSYLTSDPAHRAVAYGLELPPAASPERVALAYALARLLAAFESGEPSVGHGDLSTKNVLWSLQRGPEVFVLDCDNCERFSSDGRPLDPGERRRAMTPNWNDPAVPAGQNPSHTTDRYSLALMFLRVVGAANFPIQARQRTGGRVEIRFPVPAGAAARPLLDPGAAVWDLCARSLSVSEPGGRPPAADWAAALEDLLEAMGARHMTESVQAAQGGRTESAPTPPPAPPVPVGGAPAVEGRDIGIVPVPAPRRDRNWARVTPQRREEPAPNRPAVGLRYLPVSPGRPAPANPASAQPRRAGGQAPAGPAWTRPSAAAGTPAPGTATAARGPGPPAGGAQPASVWPEIRAGVVRFLRWWVAVHRQAYRSVTGRGPRSRRAVLASVTVDFVITVLGLALLALIVSPVIGS